MHRHLYLPWTVAFFCVSSTIQSIIHPVFYENLEALWPKLVQWLGHLRFFPVVYVQANSFLLIFKNKKNHHNDRLAKENERVRADLLSFRLILCKIEIR